MEHIYYILGGFLGCAIGEFLYNVIEKLERREKHMSLEAFLKPIDIENKKIVVSNRFVENGKPVEWEIRVLTAEQNNKLMKSSITKTTGKKGVPQRDYDEILHLSKMAAASVVYPDLQNAKLQDAYNAMGSEDLLQKMLTVTEYNRLTDFVIHIYDMNKTADELLDEAKN